MSDNHVWIFMEGEHIFEGGEVLGVFTSRDAALAAASDNQWRHWGEWENLVGPNSSGKNLMRHESDGGSWQSIKCHEVKS